MIDLYEVQVSCHNGDPTAGDGLRLEHRFADMPDVETLKMLKRELEDYYHAIFDEEPVAVMVIVMRLTSQEEAYQRGTAKNIYEAGSVDG